MTEHAARPIGFAIWLIVASVIGWWAAFQLTVEKFTVLADPEASLSCDFSVLIQCGVNLNSWQGEVFGFPNPILGLTGWMAPLVVAVAILAGAQFARWFWLLFGAGITFAMCFVIWLISQSIYSLGTLCPWCMATWAVTIPTLLATMLHLVRNGSIPASSRTREWADSLMRWVPVASILIAALIILLAQLRGLDLLGEVAEMIF